MQRHPLPRAGEPAHLLDGHPRLAAARPAPHVHPGVLAEQIEHLGLWCGEHLTQLLALQHVTENAFGDAHLRGLRAGQRGDERAGVRIVRRIRGIDE